MGVFVSDCCVTNHKALICKYLFSLMVSVGQVFGNSQRGKYGLGFLGVKMQAWRLHCGQRTHSHGCHATLAVGRRPSPSSQAVGVSSRHDGWLPQSKWPKRGRGRRRLSFPGPALGGGTHSFHHILPVGRDTH